MSTSRVPNARTAAVAIVAVVVGLVIAYVDSRPTWDDTGITAAVLFGSAFLIAFVAARRPWLWGGAVGVWVPLFSLFGSRDPATLAGLAFALAGAFAGWAAARLWREARLVR